MSADAGRKSEKHLDGIQNEKPKVSSAQITDKALAESICVKGESHAELLPVNESTFAVCTLKTEYRIKHQTMRNVSKETFHGDRDKTSKSKSKRKQARKKPGTATLGREGEAS